MIDPGEARFPHDFKGLPSTCTQCGEHEEGLTLEKYDCPVLLSRDPRVQIHVTLLDGSHRFYPVDPELGWKIDAGSRCLIIGKSLGRIYVPLDNVDCFSPEMVLGKE